MLAHTEQLELLIDNHSPLIIFLSETCLTSEINASETEFIGYTTIRCDSHSRHTGGVAAIIKNCIKWSDVSHRVLDKNTWILSVKITTGLPGGIYTVLYHSPNSSNNDFIDFLEYWHEDIVKDQNACVILGDFNIDMKRETAYSRKLKNLINSLGMKQIVKGCTRITEYAKTQIDLVITNLLNVKVNILNGIADHEMLDLHFKTRLNVTDCEIQVKTIFDKNAYESDKLSAYLQTYNWCQFDDLSVNYRSGILVQQLQNAVNKFLRTITIKTNKNSPWFTNELRNLQQQRNRLYSRAKITGNPVDWGNYKVTKNSYNKLIKSRKNEFYQKQIDNCRGDSKKMWKKLKELINTDRNKVPDSIKFNDDIMTNPFDIAENFNKYFIDSISEIHASINNTAGNIDLNNVGQNCSSVFTFRQIDIAKLNTVIAGMKNKASTDGITLQIIKDSMPIIGNVLLEIINDSFQTGIFPEIWKTTVVTPIPKIAGTKTCTEFRPINMLPTLEKIIEQIAKEQLQDYLEHENLLIERQSGFRKNHSCETALNMVLADWKDEIEQDKKIVSVFLDLKRAFETIDRDILLSKMEKYGITGIPNNWFRDYLSERYQIVMYDGAKSEPRKNTLGVPQGSILGPLLFILYINDIDTILENCKLNLFADDTLITMSDRDVNSAVDKMNSELINISKWLKVNKLKLNTSKTKAMIITTRHLTEPVNGVVINGDEIEYVAEMKYLGIVIDDRLRFRNYVDFLVKKVAKKIGFFGRISSKLNVWSKILVYKCIIAPHFEYCSTVLFLATEGDIQRLQKLQNRVMRIILRCHRRTKIADMLEILQWLSIKQRVYLNTLVFVFKLVRNILPSYMNKYLVYNKDIHNYETRIVNNFRLPANTKSISQNSFFYKGLKLYNGLPDEAKVLTNAKQFKKSCSEYVKTVLPI